jgi:hypothetical protein
VAHWYKIMNDPRYQMQQLRQNAAAMQRNVAALKPTPAKSTPPKPAPPKSVSPKSSPVAKDWNFSLQTTGLYSGVATPKLPAKYSFNETGASCANDFVIYGLDTPGSSTQANLIGVNNLYVGASEGGGCGSISGNGGNGTNPTPQVEWAFNVGAANVTTGVVLNLTGTKVAYVLEHGVSGSGAPVLQVLTLPSTQSGTITAPTSPSATCGAAAPSICSVTLSSSTSDSNSSLFVDYATDTGYVGDDNGTLYKITGVFAGTPALAGSPWPVNTGAGDYLASPVYDGATGTVFVGSYNGYLYGYTSGGSAITNSPIQLAVLASSSGSPNPQSNSWGLYYAPPIVDSTNHVLYEFVGSNPSNTPDVAQVVFYDHTAAEVEFVSGSAGTPGTTSTAIAGTNLATFLTTLPGFVIADGAFSHGYFTGGPSTTSFLYACGAYQTTSPYGITVQQFGFNASGQLQTPTTVTANSTLNATTGDIPYFLCSPATEFYSTNGTPTDYLFLSFPIQSELYSFSLPSGGGSMAPTAVFTGVSDGASGIIVDGADPTTNASSLYFTSQDSTGASCTTGGAGGTASPQNDGIGTVAAAICAYKLTQSGLL